jgi:hypothetical protein
VGCSLPVDQETAPPYRTDRPSSSGIRATRHVRRQGRI